MRKEEFLSKLSALLRDYNVEIQFVCASCSDTHGLYNDSVVINMNREQIFDSECWIIDYKSIKKE